MLLASLPLAHIRAAIHILVLPLPLKLVPCKSKPALPGTCLKLQSTFGGHDTQSSYCVMTLLPLVHSQGCVCMAAGRMIICAPAAANCMHNHDTSTHCMGTTRTSCMHSIASTSHHSDFLADLLGCIDGCLDADSVQIASTETECYMLAVYYATYCAYYAILRAGRHAPENWPW